MRVLPCPFSLFLSEASPSKAVGRCLFLKEMPSQGGKRPLPGKPAPAAASPQPPSSLGLESGRDAPAGSTAQHSPGTAAGSSPSQREESGPSRAWMDTQPNPATWGASKVPTESSPISRLSPDSVCCQLVEDLFAVPCCSLVQKAGKDSQSFVADKNRLCVFRGR